MTRPFIALLLALVPLIGMPQFSKFVEYRALYLITEAGKPTVVSALRDLPDGWMRGRYGWIAEIEWRYAEPATGSVLDSPKLPEPVQALDERVEKSIVSGGLGLPAAVIRASDGHARFTYYVRSRQVVEENIEPAVRSGAGPDATVTAREDADWAWFKKYLSTVPFRYR